MIERSLIICIKFKCGFKNSLGNFFLLSLRQKKIKIHSLFQSPLYSGAVIVSSQVTCYSAAFSKLNPVWFGKGLPKKCVGFSKPIPVWCGKANDFARRRFQTKFRLFFWWPLSTRRVQNISALFLDFDVLNFVLVILQQQPQQYFTLRPCLQLRCPDNTDK